MRVLITDKINQKAVDIVSAVAEVDNLPTMSEDELVEVIGKYDALLVRSQTKVTEKIINAASNMKIIGRAGVGVDNIDLNAATNKGIIVVNSPDGNTHAAAEHTVALMLAMARNVAKADASIKEGKWERSKFTGVEVYGKTLGVIGFGKIGQHVARVALALGMKLVVSDPYTTKDFVEKFGGTYVENLEDFWALPDFITVHTPKTKETTNLINKETFSKMKPTVRIINCARGGIINEVELKEAVENGVIAGCAIDVFEDEKNIAANPLITLDKNCTLTPHLGASTDEAQINVALDVAGQVVEVLSGRSATSAVNIPSLRPDKLEPVKDYMKIAENIAEFAVQISEGSLKGIEVEVRGTLANLDVSPLEVAVLKGVLSSHIENVNYVNAPIIAKNRGIEVKTIKSGQATDYIGSISVKLTCEKKNSEVQGALIAKDIKRIVKINDYVTSIKPEVHMLLVPHINKPKMIAQVAGILGDDNINISRMNVAQKSHRENATEIGEVSIMLISTDTSVAAETLDKISALDGVEAAKYVNLAV